MVVVTSDGGQIDLPAEIQRGQLSFQAQVLISAGRTEESVLQVTETTVAFTPRVDVPDRARVDGNVFDELERPDHRVPSSAHDLHRQ